jgi:hypothetical protein
MRQLVLKEKTGFKVTNPYEPVIIRDFRGILFYTTEPLLPKVKEFNLPPGTYFVQSGYIQQKSNPVDYKSLRLPPYERNMPVPSDFVVKFGTNPNKCTIFWDLGYILFDNHFKEKPLYEVAFILNHEMGHSKYKTEKYADLFAANEMLKKGYNPSQIGVAPIDSLSEMQYERKRFIVNNL